MLSAGRYGPRASSGLTVPVWFSYFQACSGDRPCFRQGRCRRFRPHRGSL